MKTRIFVVTAALTLFFVWGFGQGKRSVQQPAEATFRISLSDESYFKDERIVGFEITVENGYLTGLRSIPIGWGLQINNESGWRCTVSGLVAQGASALSKRDLEKLFAIAYVKGEKMAPTVDLTIHTTKDFEQSTKHMLHGVNLVPLDKPD
jgi:hypothetical protein